MMPYPVLQRRWAPEILLALSREGVQPVRFNRLMAAIEGISDRVLTERLRELAAAGLIERQVIDFPLRVNYSLTERALALIAPLRQLAELSA